LAPANPSGYFALGELCRQTGEKQKADSYFRKVLEIDPSNENAKLYLQSANAPIRPAAPSKPVSINHNYRPVTIANYRKIRDTLRHRGIKLVCVQYPLRELRPLQDMLGEGPDIYFVDNDSSFKNAVQEKGYTEYFVDNSGGDFGHCTTLGNRLLAQNISEVIRKNKILESGPTHRR
jgi:tetratricopeptide (TPR) repeat protein